MLPAQTQQLNLEQRRAQFAWECVNNARTATKNFDEYCSLARSASATIQKSGLGQTIAFLLAKATPGSHHEVLAGQISTWINGRMELNLPGDPPNILDWIVNGGPGGFSQEKYRLATAEAIALLVWLKRFAESEGR